MEKEYIAGEPQRYEIGGRVFIVEPRYRKDGESMADILLKTFLLSVFPAKTSRSILWTGRKSVTNLAWLKTLRFPMERTKANTIIS